MQKATVRFGAIWLGWLVLLVPFIRLTLPMADAGDAGEFVFVAALLTYFSAPFLLIAYLE